jgi:hypothetical protein
MTRRGTASRSVLGSERRGEKATLRRRVEEQRHRIELRQIKLDPTQNLSLIIFSSPSSVKGGKNVYALLAF